MCPHCLCRVGEDLTEYIRDELNYTQITDTHDNISKGEKIILSQSISVAFPVHSV